MWARPPGWNSIICSICWLVRWSSGITLISFQILVNLLNAQSRCYDFWWKRECFFSWELLTGLLLEPGSWLRAEGSLFVSLCLFHVFWGITLSEGGGTSCCLWCCYELTTGLCGAAFNGSDKRWEMSLIHCAHFDPFSEGTRVLRWMSSGLLKVAFLWSFCSCQITKKSCHNSNVEMNKYWSLGAVFILPVSVTNGPCSGCSYLRRCRIRVSVSTKSF